MAKHRSEIFRLSEEYFDKNLEFDTVSATYLGIHKFDGIWSDLSFHKVDPFIHIPKRYKKRIEAAEPIDHYDELARENILYDINDYLSTENDYFFYTYWGSIFPEPETIYEVFKQMPSYSEKDLKNLLKRMDGVPKILNMWISSLQDAKEHGYVNAKIRVEFTIDVIRNYSKKFVNLAKTIRPDFEDLHESARFAEIAYDQLALWLEHEYLPMCSDDWRLGEERYLKFANYTSGMEINPRELYEWGMRDLEDINKKMWEVAKQIKPGAKSLVEVRDFLNSDPKYIIKGVDNFKKFLEDVIQQAIKDLNKKVFDIPVESRDCIVVMDYDTIDESPYYFSPSVDFQKPGRTIYPVIGRDEFTTWENYSTWFHESIPGHHLQFVTAALNEDTLSKWQRTMGWNSGYSEGWALYSERLMDELGYFKDPGYQMGYLMCQAMRSARLVVDTGLHLGYKDPKGKVWNFNSAVKFMEERALLTHRYAVNEIKRYISWGGQAVSYKVGEKVWLEARAEAQERLGTKFNLRKFHMYALKLGPMKLDTLKAELAKWDGK